MTPTVPFLMANPLQRLASEMQRFGIWQDIQRPLAVDVVDYMKGPHAIYKEREPPFYYDIAVPNTRGTYSSHQVHQDDSYRYPPYYSPPSKAPLRQDVPPSLPKSHQLPGYGTGRRRGKDQYPYRTQDLRQKHPMTAAV